MRKKNSRVHALSPSEALHMAEKPLPNDWNQQSVFSDTIVQWREATLLLFTFHCVARFADVQKLSTANLSFEKNDLIIQFGRLNVVRKENFNQV